MQQYLLSCLLFTPLVAAFVALLIPSRLHKTFGILALACSLVQVIFLLLILSAYNPAAGLQFVEHRAWITLDLGTWGMLKAEYLLGLDGLSMPLISLAVAIMLIAVISSWTIEKNVKGYFVLLLILNTAIIGSFVALDFLLFYLFFEFMLLPMFFLIGIWGGARREYASIKFFLYTLSGSILILIVMIGLYISVQDADSNNTFSLISMRDPANFISGSVLDPYNVKVFGPW